ncbi:hypothetical protein Esti_001990 [Eimeria stiedai]
MKILRSIRFVPLACALCSCIQIYHANAGQPLNATSPSPGYPWLLDPGCHTKTMTSRCAHMRSLFFFLVLSAADTPEMESDSPSAPERQAEQPAGDGAASKEEVTDSQDTLSQASTSATDTFELPTTSSTDEDELLVPPTGDDTQASLRDLLTAHFQEPRTPDVYPPSLAESLVAWVRETAELVTGPNPMQRGAAHLSPPFLQQHIMNMRRGIAAPRRKEYWWNSVSRNPPTKKSTLLKTAKGFLNRFRRNLPKHVTQRLWDVCSDTSESAFFPGDFPTSVLELLLRIDKKAHLILEAAMVGLFGACTPFFFIDNGGAFNCEDSNANTPLLEAALYVPLIEVMWENLCIHQCLVSSAADRAVVLSAMESGFSKAVSGREANLLGMIPVAPPYKTAKLDSTLHPWFMAVGGTYFENAGVEVLERIETFTQVLNSIPIEKEGLLGDARFLARILCSMDQGQSQWISGEVSDMTGPVNAAILGGLVARLLTVLESITGPANKENKDWSRVQELLFQAGRGWAPTRSLEVVYQYMRAYAEHIETAVLSSIVPASVRAMALLVVGIWAKHENHSSDNNAETTAKRLLLFFLLVNREGPVKEAIDLLRSTSKNPKKPLSLSVGSVVRIAMAEKGEKERVVFSNIKGLKSPRVPLTEKGLKRFLMHVAAKSEDPLAPLQTAASVMSEIHRAKLEGSDSLVIGTKNEELLSTRFVIEFHCGAVEYELVNFFASREQRHLTTEQQNSLLKKVRITVRHASEVGSKNFELRCAFSSDKNAAARIIRASRAVHSLGTRIGRIVRRLGSGVLRFLRHPLKDGVTGAATLDELSLKKPDFTARRQLKDEWSRVVEVATEVPFAKLRQTIATDDPETTLEDVLDINQLNGVQEQVLVATDYDDTLVASGGWRMKGLGHFLGGVDASYARGVPYPGIGGLIYMLSMGSRRREGDQFRPVDTPVLPIMLLSARPSIKFQFRPPRLYKHIAMIYKHDAALLGAEIKEPLTRVVYENHVSLVAAMKGKEERGKAKIGTLLKLLRNGEGKKKQKGVLFHSQTRAVFLGDSYERDMKAGIALALLAPKHVLGSFIHLVSAEEAALSPAATPSTFLHGAPKHIQLPGEALPFKIPLIWAAHKHRWLNKDLNDILQGKKLPPPPIFVNCQGVIRGNNKSLELKHLPRDKRTPLKANEIGKPIIPYSTTLGAMVTARAFGMIDNNDLKDFVTMVGRSQRATAPPGAVTPPLAALQLAYDAQVAAALYPVTVAALRSFYQQQQTSIWGPLGEAYGREQCMRTVKSSVLELLFSPTSGNNYTREQIEAAMQVVSGVLVERICGMRNMLSNICLLAQQEEEYVSSEIALVAGKLVYRASQCRFLSVAKTPSASLQQAGPQPEAAPAPLLSFLTELCLSQPHKCRKMLEFMEDLERLAELRAQNAHPSAFATCQMRASNLRLTKVPNALFDFARDNQGMLASLAKKPVVSPPSWTTITLWETVVPLLRLLKTCVLQHLDLLLQDVSRLPEEDAAAERVQFLQLPVRHFSTSIKPTSLAEGRSSRTPHGALSLAAYNYITTLHVSAL